jgi:glutathione reductase (NADPH)
MNYDFVVIGGGNAGLSAANRVAAAGKTVALMDKGPVGGLCSLAGCNPKKVLVRASEMLDEVRRAKQHGITTGEVRIDWSAVIDRKNTFTEPITRQTEEGLRKKGIDLIRASGRFVSPDRVAVGDKEIRAAGFVVATGSQPRALDVPGAELARISDDILNLREVPKRLVIVGAGVVAFEFGFVFARLGSAVTLIVRRDRALPTFDRGFLVPFIAFAEELGIRFAWKSKVSGIRRERGAFAVQVQGETGSQVLSADFVLNAAGRIPALDQLDLDRAGVETDPRGVKVNEYLRCPNNAKVFAGGDAHGVAQLSPVASYEGRIISRNFLHGDTQRADYSIIPRAVFTTPALAQVGVTEEAAKKSGMDAEVTDNDMRDWKVFAIAGEERARARTVIERSTGRLLGAQLWASTAPDMIQFLAMAIRARLKRDELEDLVYVYPTPTSALASAFR